MKDKKKLVNPKLIVCMTVLLAFGHSLPSFSHFLVFATVFVFYQFAGAGIPNATILVLIPALGKYWGFDDSMVEFTIAFYVIVEPIATIGNILANSIFVIFCKKQGQNLRMLLKGLVLGQ